MISDRSVLSDNSIAAVQQSAQAKNVVELRRKRMGLVCGNKCSLFIVMIAELPMSSRYFYDTRTVFSKGLIIPELTAKSSIRGQSIFFCFKCTNLYISSKLNNTMLNVLR